MSSFSDTHSSKKDHSSRSKNRKSSVTARVARNTRDAISNFVYSPYVLSIPAIIYLFLGSTDFLVLIDKIQKPETLFYVTGSAIIEDDIQRYTVELIKQKIAFASYGFAAFLFLPLLFKFVKFYGRFISIPLIFAVLLATMTVSLVPVKVFTNVVHLGFGAIVAYLFAYGQRDCTRIARNTCIMIGIPTIGIAIASFIIWLNADVGGFDYLATGQRYSGLPGNPNSLGSVCMVATWCTATLMTQRQNSWLLRAFALVLTMLVITVIILTGSQTSLIVAVILCSLLITERSFSHFDSRVRVWIIMGIAFFFVLIIGYAAAFYVGESILNIFTESLGKDATFTGRTDLWIVALDAIKERPILGWGYDAHQTVLSFPGLAVPHNHYHNGFLDTMVAGGILLWIVLAYNFWQYFYGFGKAVTESNLFPLLLPLLILFLQNVSEYSMLRNNNPLWQTYFICFHVMAFFVAGSQRKSRSRRGSRNKRNKSSGDTPSGKRYRFG